MSIWHFCNTSSYDNVGWYDWLKKCAICLLDILGNDYILVMVTENIDLSQF